MKRGRPKEAYCIHPKRKSRNKMIVSLRAICHGVKIRMRQEPNPEKKAMWAEIGIELNNLLLNIE